MRSGDCSRDRARTSHTPAPHTAPDPGPDRVLTVFDALEVWMRDNDRGCGFVNAFAGIGGTDHPGLGVIRKERTWGRDLLVRLACEADLDDAQTLGRRPD
ncbi:hypothetical protein ACNHUS_03280 [Actinomycetes bacterium M1A6_2h]